MEEQSQHDTDFGVTEVKVHGSGICTGRARDFLKSIIMIMRHCPHHHNTFHFNSRNLYNGGSMFYDDNNLHFHCKLLILTHNIVMFCLEDYCDEESPS